MILVAGYFHCIDAMAVASFIYMARQHRKLLATAIGLRYAYYSFIIIMEGLA